MESKANEEISKTKEKDSFDSFRSDQNPMETADIR